MNASNSDPKTRPFGTFRPWNCTHTSETEENRQLTEQGTVATARCSHEQGLSLNIYMLSSVGRLDTATKETTKNEPVAHIWFTKTLPSRIGLLLNMTLKDLEKVLDFESFMVTDRV